ncbi:type 1 glutamine amidotransferase [Acidihalobacter ferrooxydans]|uniref:GMP synthase n=1 Tax=Acidihalobacter ferrooxydans TaxID=1765967 RepID=A0A1P8UJ83_9GAMM|nr:GMP synthase [Acidihalobacter ferrooxydans]APZ43909.1 GMP synthase [Acidihalobacter ferrooxydans]
MKNYMVVQNTYSEFLGLIEKQLERRDIGFDYHRPFLDQGLPASVGQFDGLFVLAGACAPNDEKLDYHDDVLRVIQLFRKAQRPVTGIGLGGLLVAEALGGTARAEPEYVAGFVTAHKTPAGEGDALAEALDGLDLFVLHHGAVDLPDGMEPILVDDDGNWLAIHPEPYTYGLLFRPEMKPGMLEDIIMEEDHNPPPNIGELLGEARMNWGDMQRVTDKVVVALVSELGLMQERRKVPVFSLKVE